jgi:hypothetical protein
VDSAFAVAVRRWPPSLRDELSREWAAELHVIAHEPRATAAVRSWRSLAFTVSLACARGIEKEQPTEGRSLMRTMSRPLIRLALVPVTMAVLLAVVMIVATILQEALLDPVVSFSGPAFILQDMGSPAAVIAAVALGLLGRRRARRTPLPFLNPVQRAVATVAGLMAGVTGLIALTAPVGSDLLGYAYPMELVYLLTWAALFALSLVAAHRLSGLWTWLVAGVGGIVAWYVAQTLAIAVAAPHGPPPTGLAMAPLSMTLGDSWLMPSLLLGLTVFTLTYLRGSQVEASKPSPSPDPVTA